MTKEELRSKILELEEAMREEDSKSTTAKLSDEWDELMSKLEDVIYDELEGVAFKIAAEECDCGWKTDITKRILK